MVMKMAARSVIKIAVWKAVMFLLCVHLCFAYKIAVWNL